MSASFLPKAYAHDYPIAAEYAKSTAYFSCEFAIEQCFKIYSGGLGFLAGSHMRAAAALRQNLCGIGILWTYGYYEQGRDENREMAARFCRNEYSFLEDTGIRFTVTVHGHPVWVKTLFLPGRVFNTVPMFFLSTDLAENDELSRAITHRLYDRDPLRRIAQYLILGAGGAKLLDELGVEPEVWHLNEAHGLAAAFQLYEKYQSLAAVQQRLVFTTHTPEEAGNEKHPFELLRNFSFFGNIPEEKVREITGIIGPEFNHTLAALRLAHSANGVSKLHGEVSRNMWRDAPNICKIQHITNAQNKAYWADPELEQARLNRDAATLRRRKRVLKQQLFRVVADQTGKLFDPDILTLVWARRFASYKRPELLTHDMLRFEALLNNRELPLQILWAGKPYPFDTAAIATFDHLIRVTAPHQNASVLVGYELELSRLLKTGSDVWLNNPIVTREASGTSGMTAAMNASINLSTADGWVCEFAKTAENAFIVPAAAVDLNAAERDQYDLLALYQILEQQVLPLYYQCPSAWDQLVFNSMNDVASRFDADRMAAEYYQKIYQ
jgi:glycogen phosphorylase